MFVFLDSAQRYIDFVVVVVIVLLLVVLFVVVVVVFLGGCIFLRNYVRSLELCAVITSVSFSFHASFSYLSYVPV